MKPIRAAEQGPGVEVMSDTEGGMFVAGVGGNFIASTVMVVAGVSFEAVQSGERSLEEFLIPDPEKPGLYAIAAGSEVALKDPFDDGVRKVTTPKIQELIPPVEEGA